MPESCIPNLLLPDWPAPAAVRGFVTLRNGGVSRGPWGRADGRPGGWNLGTHCGDTAADVAENRSRLRMLLPGDPCWLDQVHGVDVDDADLRGSNPPSRAGGDLPRADAAVATRRGVVLAVLTADCLPVFLCNRSADVIALAHAGWRGLAAGVLERTLDAMRQRSADRDWMAWIGPGIGPHRFEVGDEVRAAFVDTDPSSAAAFAPGLRPGKWQADLSALARARLLRHGVRHVHGGTCCTASDAERFYSYRRDGVTGRFASLLWLC